MTRARAKFYGLCMVYFLVMGARRCKYSVKSWFTDILVDGKHSWPFETEYVKLIRRAVCTAVKRGIGV